MDDYYKLIPKEKQEEALKYAFDIRKFEIELYWKRASYFWTLIAATLIGYMSIVGKYINVEAVEKTKYAKTIGPILVLLSCIGIVFSFGWFLVNRGSKFWQENWENHVDLLEDNVIGSLYKTMLFRPNETPKSKDFIKAILTGPGAYSVSKINQLTSFYVFILWTALLIYAVFSLPSNLSNTLFYFKTVPIITLTFLVCYHFVKWGKLNNSIHYNEAIKRESSIIKTKDDRMPLL